MNETLTVVAQLAGLVFVVGSILAMGLSLTVAQIVQPLKNVRLVVLALVVNFIVAPALVYAITAVIETARKTHLLQRYVLFSDFVTPNVRLTS